MWRPHPRTPLRFGTDNRGWLKIHSPNDGKLIGEVEQISPPDVDYLAQQVLIGQAALQLIDLNVRVQWLKTIAHKIREAQSDLAHLIALEGGKPIRDARIEVERAALTFELCAEEARRVHGEQLPLSHSPAAKKKMAFTVREPIGPVLVLSAFNHPLNLLAHQVGSALASGCAVVFKPSPGTPYCGEWLAEALLSVGVPATICQICHAQNPEIELLVQRPEFQFVSFIGSAKIGWNLRRLIAPGTRIALEHGGVATAMVCADADLALATHALIRGAFYHAGQVCISTQKIFIHKNIWDSFVSGFVAAGRQLNVGDARDEKTDIGPLIRVTEKIRLIEWIKEAEAMGARVLLKDADERLGSLMGATILSHVPASCRLMNEEAFGPVVCLIPYENDEEVFHTISMSPYHFTASVFTKDMANALECAKKLSAMNVMINDHTAWRVDEMPFGGHRQSGLGMGGVRWAVEEQTRLKQVVLPVQN